jgi:hypothetical protein
VLIAKNKDRPFFNGKGSWKTIEDEKEMNLDKLLKRRSRKLIELMGKWKASIKKTGRKHHNMEMKGLTLKGEKTKKLQAFLNKAKLAI